MKYGVMGHARASEIEAAVGKESFSSFRTMGFVRHPMEKLVSSYFFNRKQKLRDAFFLKGDNKKYIRIIRSLLTRLIPKILPIEIYVLIFPMKTSYEYFHDSAGNQLVKYLGRTDQLSNDLVLILDELGIPYKGAVPHSNKTTHRSWEDCIRWKPVRRYLMTKYRRDINLYRSVEQKNEHH